MSLKTWSGALAAAAASVLVLSSQAAVVMRNAPEATVDVVTNGLGAAHQCLPSGGVTNFTVEPFGLTILIK